jgi:SAM-dependent methyltransferase
MHERYTNRLLYFNEQVFTTKQFVIPYIEKYKKIESNTRILEIGCGEGGNMKPFLDLSCEVIGVDINVPQIENAKIFLKEQSENQNYTLIAEDIYKIDAIKIGQFDLIFMRDVIEHIPNQKEFLAHIKQFLKPNGIIYFGFPPWYMPFGGHQQASRNKVISKLPYIHILPRFIYAFILKVFGVKDDMLQELLEIKDTGISIERFRNIVKQNDYQIVNETMFLINPNYEIKFKLKTKLQFRLIASLPFIRNFLTTCCYYIVKNK